DRRRLGFRLRLRLGFDLRRRLGCPHSAADLAQDTFVKVLGARDTAQIIEPRAFLTTIA
ncbi:hypothetical protein APX70_06966, partial [Pseudomonas syringae pv. maculicola]